MANCQEPFSINTKVKAINTRINDIKNVDNIILNADKALYQAKEEGRDRVIAFYE